MTTTEAINILYEEATNEERTHTLEEIEKAKQLLLSNYDPVEDAPHDAKPLWFLGKSFELLSTADVAVFAPGWENARGCCMEHLACENYKIAIWEI